MATLDFGRDFEQRAIAVARAKHDPSGLQGAVMFEGVEHDGAFVDASSVNVYEFTTLGTKAKAIKDGTKIARLLRHLVSQPENRYKSATGYFVTQVEPTAEQRQAIQAISRQESLTIHCMSIVVLQKTLVDVEEYIRLRLNAPFGSAGARLASGGRPIESYVQPTLRAHGEVEGVGLESVVESLAKASRVVITGDFGIGKSAALRQLFIAARAAYFKRPTENRFPVHINLRDCIGLRSPSEIFRRHAEELGFAGSGGLISAWRAGQVDLILDGFDELVPARWIGSARDLRSIRWQALDSVRRLVIDTPIEAGVVVCGRSQYFGDIDELVKTLGMQGGLLFELTDFDENQVAQYVGELDAPDWLPSRPLFLEFFSQAVAGSDSGELASGSRGSGWGALLELIATREASRVTSIPADTLLRLISGIAVVARSESDGLGPVTLESMRSVFYDVCGYEAEEEGVQALLRLPGLASTGLAGGMAAESRIFVDSDYSEAAYALDLARYIGAPHAEHSLRDRAKWATASSTLVAEIVSDRLTVDGFSSAVVAACANRRMTDNYYDAILQDVVEASSRMGPDLRLSQPAFFADILVPCLSLRDGDTVKLAATWSGCVIEVLDVSELSDYQQFPNFQNCDIGVVEGWLTMPPEVRDHFSDCSTMRYTAGAGNTTAIMQLAMEPRLKVALSIFKKVYAQAGGARQVPALSRGLPLDLRPLVDEVIDELVSMGYLDIGEGKGVGVARPIRARRAEVLDILNVPSRALHLFD